MTNLSQPNFLYLALLFLAMLFSGFRVSRSKKPYPVLIFTLHKFIGLGLGGWLVKIVYDRNRFQALETSQISVLVLTVALFVITVIAGGLLSVQADGGLQKIPATVWVGVERLHQFLPYMIFFATALTLSRLFQ